MKWDLLIKNARLVRPRAAQVEEADIAIGAEKFARIGTNLPPSEARSTA